MTAVLEYFLFLICNTAFTCNLFMLSEHGVKMIASLEDCTKEKQCGVVHFVFLKGQKSTDNWLSSVDNKCPKINTKACVGHTMAHLPEVEGLVVSRKNSADHCLGLSRACPYCTAN
jgi:hypothetical protein